MRNYGKVSPKLWTGRLGDANRGDPYAQAMACYLVTGPHANLAGLYRLPIAYICDDLGYTVQQVKTTLRKLTNRDYCKYDHKTERVWVVEHLRHELGGQKFKDKDKRLPAVIDILNENALTSLAKDLSDKYGLAWKGHQWGIDGGAPQEQEQEQEQEQQQEQEQEQQYDAPAAAVEVDEETWKRARPFAEQALKVILGGKAKALDRELEWATKIGVLTLRFGETWLGVALEAIKNTKPEKPQAYMHKVLDSELERQGTKLNRELASVKLPEGMHYANKKTRPPASPHPSPTPAATNIGS